MHEGTHFHDHARKFGYIGGVMSMRGGDCAGCRSVGDRLSTAVGDRRVISATGFRSELLRRHSMERSVGQEPGLRQTAPGVMVTVEERQLFGAVRRVIRRIQIDRDPLALALQAPAVPLDHGVGERYTHPVQICAIERVLKARERRLRS